MNGGQCLGFTVWVVVEREQFGSGGIYYTTEQQCVGRCTNEADAEALAAELERHAGLTDVEESRPSEPYNGTDGPSEAEVARACRRLDGTEL